MDTKPTIRRDIFSVKHFDKFLGAWCHVKMFRQRSDAQREVRSIKRDEPFAMVKIVHPAQWVVDGFLLHQNAIQ